MSKIVLTLAEEEQKALTALALSELRIPADQVRYMLRRELERLGLLNHLRDANVPAGASGILCQSGAAHAQ